MAGFRIKWLFTLCTLCCIFWDGGSSLYSQNYKEIDSLQYIADTCSRAGHNYKAAVAQNDVDAAFMIADRPLRDWSAYRTARAYVKSRQFDEAFYHITRAFEGMCLSKDSIGIAHCYSVMGQIYLLKNDFAKAGNYHLKVANVLKRNARQKGTAATAKVLYAEYFIGIRQPAEALKLLMKALDETPAAGFYNSKAYIKDRIGLCHFLLGDEEKAGQHYRQALADERANRYVDIQMSILKHLGELHLSGKDMPKAKYFLEQCIALKPLTEQSEDYVLANRLLAKLYEGQGSYEQAYNYGMEAIQAKLELMDEAMLTNTEAQSVKFDAEQLALQNSLLQATAETQKIEAQQADSRKNIFLFGFMFAIIVLATLLAFLYLYNRQKRAIANNRNNELKQQLLLTQMNPHFIFNSVDTIQSLIYEDKNDEAVEYLSKFSELTLQILENSSLRYISLREEINMTANYLVIQQLLYNHNFEFEIAADEGIDTGAIFIPPMLTQPFIENAVKHGLAEKKTGGLIKVRFFRKRNKLYFEVADNGKGLGGEVRKSHRSMATKITSERLNAIEGDIEVASIVEGGIIRGAVSRFAIRIK
ncbi:histidine kinase [uncultured Flavobacterium sp.]|uniref:tetratricopeptide repeat-containing sensor histidine kinase n=1 Tax=uncultured Flavobacterium sp. TaxID=165435 RepID=UPI0025E54C0E|nr:histidine kinase [uncultured Flavobacterium sp.]